MKNFKYILIFVLLVFSINLIQAQKETPPKGGEPKDFNLPQNQHSRLIMV